MSVSPSSAVNQINAAVAQLRLPGLTPQREAQIERQLVKSIAAANPSANWGTIATLANDIADPTVSKAGVAIDVAALDRMVVPITNSSGLSTAITALAQQLRGQSPLPAGVSTVTADAAARATSVTLASTTGMFNGDKVKLQLNNGTSFTTTITTISGNTVNLAGRLPSAISSGQLFTDTAQQLRSQSTSASNNSGLITTSVTAGALVGATSVKVASAAGMLTGDAVQLQLSDGSILQTTITGITGSATLSATAAANTSAVTLTNAAGLNNGDTVKIALDNGAVFSTIIASVAGNTVNLAAPLPSQASTGSQFSDPGNITVGLATALPVSATSGGSFTDTAKVPASTNPIAISTTLTADALGNTTSLMLASVGGMAIGDSLQVQLTNGAVFNTTIANILGNLVTIANPLPSQALTGRTVSDLVPTVQQSNAFKPAVPLSSQILATLQLQLNVLVAAANPNADVKALQTTEATLLGSTLTSTQFQQNLTALIKLATSGLTSATKLSILA